MIAIGRKETKCRREVIIILPLNCANCATTSEQIYCAIGGEERRGEEIQTKLLLVSDRSSWCVV